MIQALEGSGSRNQEEQIKKGQLKNRQRSTFETRGQSINHELQLTWFGSKILRRLEDLEIQLQNPVGDLRTLSTWHVKWITCDKVIFSTCDLFKPSWNL